MIHELKKQGLPIAAIARQTGLDRKTVRKYLEHGLAAPGYAPRQPRPCRLDPYKDYLRERVASFPDLSAKRLLREIRDLGYAGGYTAVTDFLRPIRRAMRPPFERRFETPPGRQAQVDFAHFRARFDDEPGIERIVWLFSMVLGHSRWLWGRFAPSQDLQTVMRCHIDAFQALGAVPAEILYDRMKTAVIGEDGDGTITYNASLVALLAHYGVQPRACRPYRAKTKGKVERPFRYIRQDFFAGRSFRDLDDLNAQFAEWRDTIANVQVHGTTGRVVSDALAEERPALKPLPSAPYDAVLTIERRVSHEGMVSVGGNLYSVPDTTRKRMVEVQHHPHRVRIFEEGELIADHPVLEGRNRRRIDPQHRKAQPRPVSRPMQTDPIVTPRPLAFYDAVGRRLAEAGTGEIR